MLNCECCGVTGDFEIRIESLFKYFNMPNKTAVYL